MFPVGFGDECEMRETIRVLSEYCCKENIPLVFTNADKNALWLLKSLFSEKDLEISTNRDFYDYVYDFETLSLLAGRKLSSKRNHLNNFYENDWCFEAITAENIEECAAMHNKWCDEKNIYIDKDKLKEAGAVIRGLESFFELGMVGGVIRVDGEIQGYTFGEPLGNRSNNTFVVHVEKAFARVRGAYAAINREFVNYACKDYAFINREEDMGAPNLRKAKMSYCPAFLVEKYCVKLKY